MCELTFRCLAPRGATGMLDYSDTDVLNAALQTMTNAGLNTTTGGSCDILSILIYQANADGSVPSQTANTVDSYAMRRTSSGCAPVPVSLGYPPSVREQVVAIGAAPPSAGYRSPTAIIYAPSCSAQWA